MIINLLKFVDDKMYLPIAITETRFIEINLIEVDSFYSEETYWNELLRCIKSAEKYEEEFIVICRNDKLLKQISNWESFHNILEIVPNYGVNILLINADVVTTLLPVSPNFFWIDHYQGSSFMVIYKACYSLFLDSSWVMKDFISVDKIISSLTSNKFLLYPPIFNIPFNDNAEKIMFRMQRLFKQYEKKYNSNL